MTPEERFERIERQMEFVVSQQAQFYTDLRRLEEKVEAQQGQIDQVTGQMSQIVGTVARMAGILEELIRSTDKRFQETDRRFQETDRRFQETDRRFRETDERLNILINVVERHISGGDGGGPSPANE